MQMFIGIVIGLFIGATIGMFITALITANSRTNKEDEYERIER